MSSEFTTEALIHLAHQYYPAGIEKEDPRYLASVESQRLQELLQTRSSGLPGWGDFVQTLINELPDCVIFDTTVPQADPCNSCRVSLPGFVYRAPLRNFVVCLLSQLAPVYAIYASHVDKTKHPESDAWLRFPPFPPDFQSHEAKLASLIESTFGFTRLPNDVLFTPVPDLVPRTVNYPLGEALLIDCLFTEHRY